MYNVETTIFKYVCKKYIANKAFQFVYRDLQLNHVTQAT